MTVILFDGVCNFCNGSVNFVMARDPAQRFHFASLQSRAGSALIEQYGVPPETDSIVLVEDGRYFTSSTAALRIARRLSGLWPLFYLFIVVPRFLRDWVYAIIAKNRYRWFGKSEHCRIPTPEERARFLPEPPDDTADHSVAPLTASADASGAM